MSSFTGTPASIASWKRVALSRLRPAILSFWFPQLTLFHWYSRPYVLLRLLHTYFFFTPSSILPVLLFLCDSRYWCYLISTPDVNLVMHPKLSYTETPYSALVLQVLSPLLLPKLYTTVTSDAVLLVLSMVFYWHSWHLSDITFRHCHTSAILAICWKSRLYVSLEFPMLSYWSCRPYPTDTHYFTCTLDAILLIQRTCILYWNSLLCLTATSGVISLVLPILSYFLLGQYLIFDLPKVV